jgi:hypothetical protein
VLGKQDHMPITHWPSRSTASSDALSDDVGVMVGQLWRVDDLGVIFNVWL